MAARRGRGSTAVRVIFSQHAEILQYSRKTITGRFYATDRMDVLYTVDTIRFCMDVTLDVIFACKFSLDVVLDVIL